MNKVFLRGDIIKSMSVQTGISQEKCGFCLNAYHNVLVNAVKNRDIVEDTGFFNISTKFVPCHIKGDPRDFHNKKVNIPDKYRLIVKPMKTLKNAALEISLDDNTRVMSYIVGTMCKHPAQIPKY